MEPESQSVCAAPHPIHVCIGAPRSGTTWLFNNLVQQPCVFLPMVKEVRYWNSRRSNEQVARTSRLARKEAQKIHNLEAQLQWLDRWERIDRDSPPSVEEYVDLMRRPDIPSVDISPAYSFMRPDMIPQLRRALPPGSKVIYFIRDPLARMLSQFKLHHYMHGHYRGLAAPSTHARFLQRGNQQKRADYKQVIQNWTGVFGKDFRFFVYDELASDPREFLRKVAAFLGLSLSDEISRQTTEKVYGTETVRILPKAGTAEKKLFAKALLPAVTRFSRAYPEIGGNWLDNLGQVLATPQPETRVIRDTAPRVDDLMRMCESLGEDCEYGFWQRDRGYEPSSLFRWTVAPVGGVLEFLQDNGKQGLFQPQNLSACVPGMVRDAAYGFGFPSDLAGPDGALPDRGSDTWCAGYEQEKARIDYLQQKFFGQMQRNPCVYILKSAGLQVQQAGELFEQLRSRHKDHKLLWVDRGQDTGVSALGDGVYYAQLPEFAADGGARAYHPSGWTRIMTEMSERPEIAALIKRMYV